MATIATTQAELYTGVWSSLDQYGAISHGENHVPMFLEMTGATGGTVLDAGCGSGKGALALARAGFCVALCDLTDAGLSVEARSVGPFVGPLALWQSLRPAAYLAALSWLVESDQPGLKPELPDPTPMFDYVFCADVLEHVPTEYTMLVIHRLLEVATKAVFLQIALVPDDYGVWVGESLHQTVRDFVWWRDRIAELGTILECRDCLMHGVYLVKPR